MAACTDWLGSSGGSTYQRMMIKMFESQLGKSIEVYIDDMVVKSKVVSEHVKDLDNTFEILRRHKLRLNASKCSFGVGLGKFLGYMVTHTRIEVNPDQIKAIQNQQSPQNPKEWKGFEWTEECASAFQQLKDYLARPPIMSSPEPDDVLFAYIVVVPYAIRYLPLEKAILTVVLRTRKLPHYFQTHTVVVLTQLLLKSVLRSADYRGRIAKWGTILRAFDIKYIPRTLVKGQIFVDLVAEFTKPSLEEVTAEKDMDKRSVGMISQQSPSHWEVYVDGAANQKGSGVGLVLISLERIIIEKSLRLDFLAINNETKYEALLMGMSMVQRIGGKAVELFSDSRLVVGQVQGEFEAKDERMQRYLNRVKRLPSKFEFFNLLHILRSGNAHADSLAILATSSAQNFSRVILVEDLHGPTEARRDVIQVHQIRTELYWMDPIVKFLKEDILPEEKGEADKIQRMATRF
ncbi:uncharacterized protein LOC136067219 [Quercus suber]|uniref:uncharacterized protein LOC136067219 n=1 Tax=Quercus suber TaxID=58331 RepID=UPI0032DEC2C4